MLTSVTSQNTLGVDGILDIPPEFVAKQLDAVLSDIGADAIKTGMLSSSAIIRAVVGTLLKHRATTQRLVVDPVMVSTSGSRLLAEDALEAFVENLLPITYVLTPNVPEAEVLLGGGKGSIKSLEDMRQAAKRIGGLGPKYVLLKGGHLSLVMPNEGRVVVDVLYETETDRYYELTNPYIETEDTHGTGCTLSAAIAGGLAKGQDGLFVGPPQRFFFMMIS